jgi:hypothetical protein
MVPVIVNAILNEHQLVVDIVAFVIKGDFHRSRLGEKQRGKILAGWVTRKMRTIAQYSIRDPNGQDTQMMISEEPTGRMSMSANSMMRASGGAAPSLKGSVGAGSMLGMTNQLNNLNFHMAPQEPPLQPAQGSLPNLSELPPQQQEYAPNTHTSDLHDDKTPTDARPSFLPPLQHQGPTDFSPVDARAMFDDDPNMRYQNSYHPSQQGGAYHDDGNAGVPEILRPGTSENSFAGSGQGFYSDSIPYDSYGVQDEPQELGFGRGSFEGGGGGGAYNGGGGVYKASYEPYDNTAQTGNGGGGGLRVANRHSSESERNSTDESWRRDALAQMQFVGQAGQQGAGHAQ